MIGSRPAAPLRLFRNQTFLNSEKGDLVSKTDIGMHSIDESVVPAESGLSVESHGL